MICDVSRKEFTKIYERLNIENLIERGESFYQSRMDIVVKDLEEKGKIKFSCGIRIMRYEISVIVCYLLFLLLLRILSGRSAGR
jgi:arginyl-tRNA synthetase